MEESKNGQLGEKTGLTDQEMLDNLIASVESNSTDTTLIEVKRNGKFVFAFHIRVMPDSELERIRAQFRKMTWNKEIRMNVIDNSKFDDVNFQSCLIYESTTNEDKENLWKPLWNKYKVTKRLMTPYEVIDLALRAGEKTAVYEKINEFNGYISPDSQEEKTNLVENLKNE
jgi:hypothetical protein